MKGLAKRGFVTGGVAWAKPDWGCAGGWCAAAALLVAVARVFVRLRRPFGIAWTCRKAVMRWCFAWSAAL